MTEKAKIIEPELSDELVFCLQLILETCMKREKVKSSALKSVGYDPEQKVLETELVTKRIYTYKEVPLSVYTDLMKAESLGKYYNKHIKDEYDYEEVT